MNTTTVIDEISLSHVYGGQETSGGAKVKVQGVEAEGTFSQKGTPERRNDYLTCMNDRQANCGFFQSSQSCQDMAARACSGLKGSPTNRQE